MRNWSVTVTAEAEQEIARLPRHVIADVLQMIEDLWEDPFPPDSLALRGYNGQYRLRTGTHRVLYQINKRRRTILVWRVRPRKSAYEGMKDPIN